jgi:hypothetical protein
MGEQGSDGHYGSFRALECVKGWGVGQDLLGETIELSLRVQRLWEWGREGYVQKHMSWCWDASAFGNLTGRQRPDHQKSCHIDWE